MKTRCLLDDIVTPRFLLVVLLFCMPTSGCGGGGPTDDVPEFDCHLYTTPDNNIVVHYKQVLPEGMRWLAKIIVDIDGMETTELRDGLSLDGQEFLDRVFIQTPRETEQHGELTGERCDLSLSSIEDGASLVGTCAFTFDDGYDLEVAFDCEIDLIE